MPRLRYSLRSATVAVVIIATGLWIARLIWRVHSLESALSVAVAHAQFMSDQFVDSEARRRQAESDSHASLAGANMTDAVSFVVEAVDSDDEAVRLWAVHTLGRIGRNASPGIATLVRALNDPDPIVRREAAWALGRIGPSAAQAISTLRQTYSNDPDFVSPHRLANPSRQSIRTRMKRSNRRHEEKPYPRIV